MLIPKHSQQAFLNITWKCTITFDSLWLIYNIWALKYQYAISQLHLVRPGLHLFKVWATFCLHKWWRHDNREQSTCAHERLYRSICDILYCIWYMLNLKDNINETWVFSTPNISHYITISILTTISQILIWFCITYSIAKVISAFLKLWIDYIAWLRYFERFYEWLKILFKTQLSTPKYMVWKFHKLNMKLKDLQIHFNK